MTTAARAQAVRKTAGQRSGHAAMRRPSFAPAKLFSMRDRRCAPSARRDAGCDPLVPDSVSEPVGDVVPVGRTCFGLLRPLTGARAPMRSLVRPPLRNRRSGLPTASVTAWSLEFRPPSVRPMSRPRHDMSPLAFRESTHGMKSRSMGSDPRRRRGSRGCGGAPSFRSGPRAARPSNRRGAGIRRGSAPPRWRARGRRRG